jgi:hypothetical protein
MGRVTRKALAMALALALAASGGGAAADVVVLQNGARLEGRVVSLDEKEVRLEQTSPEGKAVVAFPRADVRAIELAEGDAVPARPPGGPKDPVRDEWWLLKADGAVRGTRHLLLVPHADEHGSRWRIEEHVRLFAAPKVPGVRVVRIEDVDDEWRPRHVHYRELGDASAEEGGLAGYETIRSGPVAERAWRLEGGGRGAPAGEPALALPEGTTTPLALRESLARARPRRAQMAAFHVLDSARGEVRPVRAGFARLDAREGDRSEDVMRVEDGARVYESRWVAGDPPRCVLEEVPGFVAVVSTKAQAEAAAAAEGKATPPAPGAPVAPGTAPVPAPDPKVPGPRSVTVADPGLSIPVPGASWTVEPPPPPTDDSGRRVVAKLWSSLHAADVRVEWEPSVRPRTGPEGPDGKTSAPPPDAEAALLARLKRLSPDVAVVVPRNAVATLPGAWSLTLSGTRNGERVRTLVLVAERGAGRATLLATCPESAWPDAKTALESVLAGFRWL